MKKRIKTLAVLGVLLFGFLAFTSIDKKVIAIDAGHGGYDAGADILGIEEKTITEAVAQKIKEQNKDSNIEIVLIRDGDTSMDLRERTNIINKLKPDLVISLHVNGNRNAIANGVDAYISSKNKTFNEQSREIAENLVNKITETGNLVKRRVSEAPFHILTFAECPIVHVEMGYLSNEKDRNYITSEKGQDEIASKILEAIQ